MITIAIALVLWSCSGSGGAGTAASGGTEGATGGISSDTGTDTGTDTGVTAGNSLPAPAATAVKMQADFTTVGAAPFFRAAPPVKLTSCPSTTTDMDGPQYAAGLDCDQDGGAVSFLTPQNFIVALKRLSFVKNNDERVDFLPDRGALAQSLVFDLTSQITVSQLTIPEGTYTSVEAEIYYYEIKMPVNNPQVNQRIRVYLSDDDFPAEGGLGHHQGDITLVDENGQELGWVDVATVWTTTALQTNTASLNRPGGIDAETGHQRGLFGDANLWDQADFMQGTSQDIFLISRPLGPSGLTVTADQSATVTLIFNVKDSWFWEDFDGDGHFNPCENGTLDACDQNAEWAPIFKLPVLTIQ